LWVSLLFVGLAAGAHRLPNARNGTANLLPAGSDPLPMTKEQLASLVSAPGLDTDSH
jgi:hypothetical protein